MLARHLELKFIVIGAFVISGMFDHFKHVITEKLVELV